MLLIDEIVTTNRMREFKGKHVRGIYVRDFLKQLTEVGLFTLKFYSPNARNARVNCAPELKCVEVKCHGALHNAVSNSN